MTLEGTQERKERCQPVLLVYTWQSVVDSWAGSRDSLVLVQRRRNVWHFGRPQIITSEDLVGQHPFNVPDARY